MARYGDTKRTTRTRPGRSPWASAKQLDFHFDATADGRWLKFLNVIDEQSRYGLAILQEHHLLTRSVQDQPLHDAPL